MSNTVPIVVFGSLAALYWFRWEVGDAALDLTQGGTMGAVDTLARTIWGEARGEGTAGMEAVANVVMNRVAFSRARGGYWWGNTVEEVCRKPWQFSCWNPTDPNVLKLRQLTTADTQFRQAITIAAAAVDGRLPDRTGGATHYHAPSVRPAWRVSAVKTAMIGAHTFYRGIA
jgi:spore germination cell wall hydrolase CwlJ-like protein